jgi:hypothetical protein
VEVPILKNRSLELFMHFIPPDSVFNTTGQTIRRDQKGILLSMSINFTVLNVGNNHFNISKHSILQKGQAHTVQCGDHTDCGEEG